jgi:hypothetical protein
MAGAGARRAIGLDQGADPQSVVRVDGELVYRPSFTHRARVAAAPVWVQREAAPSSATASLPFTCRDSAGAQGVVRIFGLSAMIPAWTSSSTAPL